MDLFGLAYQLLHNRAQRRISAFLPIFNSAVYKPSHICRGFLEIRNLIITDVNKWIDRVPVLSVRNKCWQSSVAIFEMSKPNTLQNVCHRPKSATLTNFPARPFAQNRDRSTHTKAVDGRDNQ